MPALYTCSPCRRGKHGQCQGNGCACEDCTDDD